MKCKNCGEEISKGSSVWYLLVLLLCFCHVCKIRYYCEGVTHAEPEEERKT